MYGLVCLCLFARLCYDTIRVYAFACRNLYEFLIEIKTFYIDLIVVFLCCCKIKIQHVPKKRRIIYKKN